MTYLRRLRHPYVLHIHVSLLCVWVRWRMTCKIECHACSAKAKETQLEVKRKTESGTWTRIHTYIYLNMVPSLYFLVSSTFYSQFYTHTQKHTSGIHRLHPNVTIYRKLCMYITYFPPSYLFQIQARDRSVNEKNTL